MSRKNEALAKDQRSSGSGRIFDTFKIPDRGERLEYQGRAARGLIIAQLADWPKARAIAAKIADFYGDYLRYYENETLASSRYELRLQHEPLALQHARIELQLGTPRTAEALIHELLHLNIWMRDYPIGEKFWIPSEIDRYVDYMSGMYPKIGNLLEHELIIDVFLGLGFDKANFLGYLSPAPDYQAVAANAVPSLGYVEAVGFSWWCLEYLRHWISARHWVGDEPALYADSALYWGSRVHPEMRETASQIRGLIESEALKDRRQYPCCVNRLLQRMKVPKFTDWAAIQARGPGRPVAVRLTRDTESRMLNNRFQLTGNPATGRSFYSRQSFLTNAD